MVKGRDGEWEKETVRERVARKRVGEREGHWRFQTLASPGIAQVKYLVIAYRNL